MEDHVFVTVILKYCSTTWTLYSKQGPPRLIIINVTHHPLNLNFSGLDLTPSTFITLTPHEKLYRSWRLSPSSSSETSIVYNRKA